MKKAEILAAIGLFLAVWGLLAVGTSQINKPENEYAFDFFTLWYGSRQVLLEGASNPYSPEIERAIQGYLGFEGYTPYLHNFGYPAPVIYTLLPFWLLPWKLGVYLWAGLALTLSLTLPLIVFLNLDWRIPPPLLALLTFFSAFVFRHTMNNYLLGQFVVFALASLIFSWWAISSKKPALSAIALIFATVRPDGAILAGAMLVDLALTRHFKTLAIWAGIMGGVLLVSFLQLGWWVDDMLVPLRGYQKCCVYAYPPSEAPGGRAIEIAVILMAIAWAAWMLLRMRGLPDVTRIAWSLSTVIVAYLLIFAQSKDYTLIYLLIPLWVSLWSTRGYWLSSLVVLAILASPWVYWRTGLTLGDGNPKEQLVTPIITGIVLTLHWLRWSQGHAAVQSDAGLLKAQESASAP